MTNGIPVPGPLTFITLPAYFDAAGPNDSVWNQLGDGFQVVVEAWFDDQNVLASVYNKYYPGPPQSQSYIPCYGYVSTKRTMVPLPNVKAEIISWFDRFPTLDGVFVDEADILDEQLSDEILEYYRDIYQSVKAKSADASVRLNCPGCKDERLMQACDAPVLVEQNYTQYLNPSWWEGASRPWWRQYEGACHIVTEVTTKDEMLQVCDLVAQRGARNIYVYDGTSASYDHLPCYWNEELQRIGATNP
jgi:Spherulation-specific family 4